MDRRKEADIMRLLILGGKLQGMEAVYLAQKAGWTAIVADRTREVPAADLADAFVCVDLTDENAALPIFRQADAVLPAMENRDVLKRLDDYGEKSGTRVLFDWEAYRISCSKKKSNELFRQLGIPMPVPWPQCGFPVVVKPDQRSGSEGVRVFRDLQSMAVYTEQNPVEKQVVQQYLPGRSYSLEAIGDGTHFCFPQSTEVVTDAGYDCKRIKAPAVISEEKRNQMMEIGRKLAGALKIHGIFDIEVIDHEGVLKILEIDARLPSQTPVSVWNSTGINMLDCMLHPDRPPVPKKEIGYCLYQQIVAEEGVIRMLGEHVLSGCRHMKRTKGFFGADEAVTDYVDGCRDFRAIIILTRDSEAEAERVFQAVIRNICHSPEFSGWEYQE